MKYIVTKIISLQWEVKANSRTEAKALVDDMGENTGNASMKTKVVKVKQPTSSAK